MSPGPALPLLPLLLLLGGPPGAGGQRPDTPPGPGNGSRPVFPCGGTLRGESGYVASEGFPQHYPPLSNCTWTITVPEGHVVALTFRVLDLEPDPRCRFDSLSIYEGAAETNGDPPAGKKPAGGVPENAAAPLLLGRFCGTFRPGPIVSGGPRVTLRMESDPVTAGRGFLLWFHARSPRPPHGRRRSGLPPPRPPFLGVSWHYFDEHQFCGGRLEKPEGGLKTPNWPDENYPPGISCSWHIVAPPGKVIELRFGKFDVEADAHCRYDYVAVFEGGAADDARRLGKFCGEGTPNPIVSSTPELLVQFVSDLSVTADGFSATYTIRGAENEPPQRCPRRAGTMQSNFCASDFVLTGTVKSASRGPPQEEGWAVVSVSGFYKGGDALGVPHPPKGATLRLRLPCRLCPALKKGSSYVLMGKVGGDGGALLPPDAFVVPYRQQQQQVLGNLSKRPCRGGP